MKTFSVRAVNLVLIVALLIGYNTVLTLRDKDDHIAKLTADLESAIFITATCRILLGLHDRLLI